jgi:PPM family protein phosphatase
MLKLKIGIICETGLKRSGAPNQDHIALVLPGFFHPHPPLLLVADGMGGHAGGELASHIVVDQIVSTYRGQKKKTAPIDQLLNCIHNAHQAVRQTAARQIELEGMGSTVAAAILTPKRLYAANVGDSRIYLVRGGHIHQLSLDQSVVADLMRKGELTPQEALVSPQRSQLNMSISSRRETIEPYTTDFALEAGDAVVLCSDGLWSLVPDALILAAVESLPPQKAADQLAALANQNGGLDNISVIVARLPGSQKTTPQPLELEDTNPGVA